MAPTCFAVGPLSLPSHSGTDRYLFQATVGQTVISSKPQWDRRYLFQTTVGQTVISSKPQWDRPLSLPNHNGTDRIPATVGQTVISSYAQRDKPLESLHSLHRDTDTTVITMVIIIMYNFISYTLPSNFISYTLPSNFISYTLPPPPPLPQNRNHQQQQQITTINKTKQKTSKQTNKTSKQTNKLKTSPHKAVIFKTLRVSVQALQKHPLRLSFLFTSCGPWTLSCDFGPHNYETLKWLSSLPTLMQKSF